MLLHRSWPFILYSWRQTWHTGPLHQLLIATCRTGQTREICNLLFMTAMKRTFLQLTWLLRHHEQILVKPFNHTARNTSCPNSSFDFPHDVCTRGHKSYCLNHFWKSVRANHTCFALRSHQGVPITSFKLMRKSRQRLKQKQEAARMLLNAHRMWQNCGRTWVQRKGRSESPLLLRPLSSQRLKIHKWHLRRIFPVCNFAFSFIYIFEALNQFHSIPAVKEGPFKCKFLLWKYIPGT